MEKIYHHVYGIELKGDPEIKLPDVAVRLPLSTPTTNKRTQTTTNNQNRDHRVITAKMLS